MGAKTAIAIYDSVVIICFSALAYLFGKWWIVLFAALFIITREKRNEDD